MEMMGSRHAVTPGGSCSLIQMLGKKVEMRYDFIDNGEHASAFDDAYECFKSALR